MTGRIKPIVKKEVRQIMRDPRTLILLLIIPAFLLVMYGYALNFDVKRIPLVVADEDRSPMSRDFIRSFFSTDYFTFQGTLAMTSEIDRLISEEKIRVALVIPPDFSERFNSGDQVFIQVIVDGSDPTTATPAIGYANAIAQSYSLRIVTRSLERRGWTRLRSPVDFRPRVWYNPELRSVKFLIPGLIAFILMVIVVISTAFAIVREKERGTMEQILVSPVRPSELVIGKTIPYVVISLISSHLVLFLGFLLFGVVIQGSYPLLFCVMVLFLTAGLGLGLLISTVAHTQQMAFMMAVLITFLPTFILSGFVFPIRNMPVAIQTITYLVPAKYFLAALRGIILKGTGLRVVWPQMLFLLGFAVVTILGSTVRLKKADG